MPRVRDMRNEGEDAALRNQKKTGLQRNLIIETFWIILMTVLMVCSWSNLSMYSGYFEFFVQFYLTLIGIYIFGIAIAAGINKRPLRESMGLIMVKILLRPVLQLINFIMMLTAYDALNYYEVIFEYENFLVKATALFIYAYLGFYAFIGAFTTLYLFAKIITCQFEYFYICCPQIERRRRREARRQ